MDPTITNTVIMVRPTNFCCNSQTMVNNYYQKTSFGTTTDVNAQAQLEFDNFTSTLISRGVNVLVLQDPRDDTPDSIFPNNHIYFTPNQIAAFPMYAENRRLERLMHPKILSLVKNAGFTLPTTPIIDYAEPNERNDKFFESTGACVVDRTNKVLFASLSPRCDKSIVETFCFDFGYSPVFFRSYQTCDDGERRLIYHTNVMMALARTFAIICLSAIDDPEEKKAVETALTACGKVVIDISEAQVNTFLGNALQVVGKDGCELLIMSSSAAKSLTSEQRRIIENHCEVVDVNIECIEMLGGGSARCMMLEVFGKNIVQ